MKRTAIYIRVSTDAQAKEGDSVPAQREALQKYINERNDLVLAGEYVDDGISGTKFTERDELQRMLADVQAGINTEQAKNTQDQNGGKEMKIKDFVKLINDHGTKPRIKVFLHCSDFSMLVYEGKPDNFNNNNEFGMHKVNSFTALGKGLIEIHVS